FGVRLPLVNLNQNSTLLLSDQRAPFLAPFVGQVDPQTALTGVPSLGDTSALGDISFIIKFALINGRDVLSLGAVITIPSGQDIFPNASPAPHSTLWQPWVGFIRDFDRFYLQGFSALVFPTDERESRLWFNDLGLCLRVYDNPQ